jgi:uncharacterized protein (UPF0333 family)
MKTVISLVVILVLVAVVGVGAYDLGQSAGEANAQNIRADFVRSRSTTTGQTDTTQQGQNAARARPLASGAIQSLNGNIMQVTQQDGSTVTVVLSPQTTVEKMVGGAQSDLKPGVRVSVQGTQATGQVDAQLIQITQSTQ